MIHWRWRHALHRRGRTHSTLRRRAPSPRWRRSPHSHGRWRRSKSLIPLRWWPRRRWHIWRWGTRSKLGRRRHSSLVGWHPSLSMRWHSTMLRSLVTPRRWTRTWWRHLMWRPLIWRSPKVTRRSLGRRWLRWRALLRRGRRHRWWTIAKWRWWHHVSIGRRTRAAIRLRWGRWTSTCNWRPYY